MMNNLFFGILVAILVLSDVVVWLRVRRLSAQQCYQHIIGGACITIATIAILGIWIIETR